jgi:hypothetical protein
MALPATLTRTAWLLLILTTLAVSAPAPAPPAGPDLGVARGRVVHRTGRQSPSLNLTCPQALGLVER